MAVPVTYKDGQFTLTQQMDLGAVTERLIQVASTSEKFTKQEAEKAMNGVAKRELVRLAYDHLTDHGVFEQKQLAPDYQSKCKNMRLCKNMLLAFNWSV